MLVNLIKFNLYTSPAWKRSYVQDDFLIQIRWQYLDYIQKMSAALSCILLNAPFSKF